MARDNTARKTYRTAAGKVIDMDAMVMKNEQTLAVGNNPVNARGDEIGPNGEVVKSKNDAVSDYYAANPNAVAKNATVGHITEDRISSEEKAPKSVSAAMSVDETPSPEVSSSPKKASSKKKNTQSILDQTTTDADLETQSALEKKISKAAAKAKTIAEEKKAKEDEKLPKAVTGSLDSLDL
jgi:hypothetical protein